MLKEAKEIKCFFQNFSFFIQNLVKFQTSYYSFIKKKHVSVFSLVEEENFLQKLRYLVEELKTFPKHFKSLKSFKSHDINTLSNFSFKGLKNLILMLKEKFNSPPLNIKN